MPESKEMLKFGGTGVVNTCGNRTKDITILIALRTEAWKEELSVGHFPLREREWIVVSQTNVETVSKNEKGSSSVGPTLGSVSKNEKGSSSVRPTLEVFQRTRKGRR